MSRVPPSPLQAPARSTPPSPAETGLGALRWAVASGVAPDLVKNAEARARRRRRRLRTAGAVAFAFALVGAGVWRWPAPSPVAVESRPIASTAATIITPETRTLTDGSVVELRPGAAITVTFGPTERRIELTAGEAHFQVTKDPARPFIVASRGVETRAVGTAFSVNVSADTVAVLVTEGQVAVASPSPAPIVGAVAAPRPTFVSAGFSTLVPLDSSSRVIAPAVAAVSEREQRARLEWRVPLLEFAGTALVDAIPLFNRHSAVRLVVDPALGQLRLSGTLRADDTDSLLVLLRNEFALATEPQSDGSLRLRRR